jgi:hypothetical protein
MKGSPDFHRKLRRYGNVERAEPVPEFLMLVQAESSPA